jgi:hypothetical protein
MTADIAVVRSSEKIEVNSQSRNPRTAKTATLLGTDHDAVQAPGTDSRVKKKSHFQII